MNEPRIEFIRTKEVPVDLQGRVDSLDKLAFSVYSDHEDDGRSIQWAPDAEWLELVWLGEELVSQLYLHKREISIGARRVWVAGVGGVATHPQRQKQGLGSKLMQAAERFMRKEMAVLYGLLLCDYSTSPFYQKNGWEFAADRLAYFQDGERRILETCVMVQRLGEAAWPAGEIDLLGLPW